MAKYLLGPACYLLEGPCYLRGATCYFRGADLREVEAQLLHPIKREEIYKSMIHRLPGDL